MKKILYTILISLTFAGCSDVLDIEDINNYNPDLVWGDENLANAYIGNLYSAFGNWDIQLDKNSDQLAGIVWYDGNVTITNDTYNNWDYTTIRLINQALLDVQQGSLDEDVKDFIKGQALFLRAYAYFNMVKYHGGVPYITTAQDRYLDDLYVSRNSTAECFNFIIKDLNDAFSLVPLKIDAGSDIFGKIDGNFVRAFESKVLLYKASPQFNPSNPWNNSYWQDAYNASKQVYSSLTGQGYALVDDYSNIALEERNSEVIFSVINSYPDKTVNWDYGSRPGSESRGPAWSTPTWEMIKKFPMKDGKLYTDPTCLYNQTDDEFLQNYWENRDPRFDKSIVWNGKIYEVSGKAGKRQYTSLGLAHELDDFGKNPTAGTNSTNLDRYTGFFILKNSNLSLLQSEVLTYDIDYVLMRLAEVILNYAETANEVGELNESINLIKLLRERAGIDPGLDGNYGISASNKEELRETIISERNIELCFEGHRFWDLRRLRMLDQLNGSTKHGVEAIAINNDGTEMLMSEARNQANSYELTEINFKYSLIQIPVTGVQTITIPDTYYFFPLRQSTLDGNHNLEQNVDWGGTFDPTLN